MTTAKATSRAVEEFENQPLVDEAWDADRGCVIAVLYRPLEDEGSIFQLLDLAKHLDMDGKIEVQTEMNHRGETRDRIMFMHENRVA